MQTTAPNFALEPTSSPAQPLSIRPEEGLTLEVSVTNPSSRVDYFRLICTNWPEEGLSVIYPRMARSPQLGAADCLTLEPGGQGTILLSLVPPLNLRAGRYVPTVRLVSANNPDLALMERIHLQVEPRYGLYVEPAASKAVPPAVEKRGWPLLLGLLTGLGLLGGLLLWLLLRSPADPQIVEFYPERSDYAAADQAVAEVGWQIAHTDQIAALKLTGYDPRGKIVSGPITYDLSQALPSELQPFCNEVAQILNCRNVPTEVRQPGEYVFELVLLPKSPLTQEAQSKTSSLVSIQGTPLPAVVELVPDQVIYSEQGATPASNGANFAPPVTEAGVSLSWEVMAPAGLRDLLLVVRQEDGTVLGGRRYSLRNPADLTALTLPKDLQPFCQLGATLVCQNVPTGIAEVGRYTFELTPVPLGQPGTAPTPARTELVQIEPRSVRIAAFRINGRDAQPRYVIPVELGQPVPGLTLSWEIEGGETARAVLLPSPGTVPLQGSVPLPINPAGETTLALQVSNGTGEPITRSVTIATYDPSPGEGAAAAAAAQAAQAAAAAAQAVQSSQARSRQAQPASAAPTAPLPAPTEAERLSPAEAPPRLD
ncbi:hypothetical protein [Pseudanabaena sp. FACHB-2040]|uniref:COG1470 family protein n=1 Tax=Pseudanabaena sp. FACHB-2040 TaxID=2692859 RepID=UPI0016831E50|nr:hypothetical protein [Pseudanabaena sp. FACHB-2040]MBD2259614.1 hypothetical protein [Pseudanabaena sp. FACHB-2040]